MLLHALKRLRMTHEGLPLRWRSCYDYKDLGDWQSELEFTTISEIAGDMEAALDIYLMGKS